MSKVVSIELLLDPESEQAVREDWRRLADAGMSSLGARTAPSNRPHVTLMVRESLPLFDHRPVTTVLPVPIQLGSPRLFVHGERGALVRPLVPSDELTALHRMLHDVAPAGVDAPHTAPGEWTPHVTLARRLPVASLAAATALLGPPPSGWATKLRRWDAATATVTPLA